MRLYESMLFVCVAKVVEGRFTYGIYLLQFYVLHDVPFGRMAAKMFTFLTSSNVLAIPRPNIAGLKSTLVSVEWMQTVEHLHKPEESKQQEVSECTTAARVLPLPSTRDKSNRLKWYNTILTQRFTKTCTKRSF